MRPRGTSGAIPEWSCVTAHGHLRGRLARFVQIDSMSTQGNGNVVIVLVDFGVPSGAWCNRGWIASIMVHDHDG